MTLRGKVDLVESQSVRIDVDSASLSVEMLGNGFPLLVVHGGLGLDHSYFRPHLDDLAVRHRLILPDLRGHGASSGRDTLGTATHATFVEDLRRVRAALGIRRWAVLGHSYGGFLALEYALSHPTDISALILCSTAPSIAHAGQAVEAASRQADPAVFSALIAALSEPATGDDSFARRWTSIAPMYFADPQAMTGVFDATRFSAAGFNRGNFHLLPTYDVRSRLREIAIPTLVLSGDRDWLMPPLFAGSELAAGMVDAHHHVFKASGHFPFVEHPAEFSSVVASWLAPHTREAA